MHAIIAAMIPTAYMYGSVLLISKWDLNSGGVFSGMRPMEVALCTDYCSTCILCVHFYSTWRSALWSCIFIILPAC